MGRPGGPPSITTRAGDHDVALTCVRAAADLADLLIGIVHNADG